MSVFVQYETFNNTNNFGTTGNSWRAQGFKIPSDSVITDWGIVGSRGNNPAAGSFTVEIWEGGTSTAARSGTLVASESYNRDVLPVYTASPVLQTFTFTTPTATLTGGSTQYFMIIHPTSGSTNDCIRWALDFNTGTYPDGNESYGSDGITFIARTTSDLTLYLAGTTEGGGGNTTDFFIMA